MTTPAPVAVTPTVSVAADKTTYSVGDAIALTVTYSDSSVSPVQMDIAVSASDAAGNTVSASVSVTVNTTAQQPMQVGVTDNFGGSWTLVSNEGGVAILTSVIGTPPAAPAA